MRRATALAVPIRRFS